MNDLQVNEPLDTPAWAILPDGASAASSRPAAWRRRGLIGAATIVAILLFYRLSLFSGPEHVTDSSPVGQNPYLYDGTMYTWSSSDALTVHALDLKSGKVRQAARYRPAPEVLVTHQKWEDGALYFHTVPKQAPYGGGVRGMGAEYLGSFLKTERKAVPPGWSIREHEFGYRSSTPAGLYRIHLRDGRVERLNVDTLGQPLQSLMYALHGDQLYWLRPGKSKTASIRANGKYWEERAADNDLMVSPLRGGAPRKLASGLPRGFQISDGLILWTASRKFPDLRKDQWYMRLRDGKKGAFRTFEGRDPYDPFGTTAVEFHDRLYWAERNEVRGVRAIVEFEPESGRTRTLIDLKQNGLMAQVSPYLHVYRGRLFAVLSRVEEAGGEAGYFGVTVRPAETSVAEVRPDAPNPIGPSRRLSPGTHSMVWFDSDHAYYVAAEKRESLFDFAFASSTSTTAAALYRVGLP
jgi:hypothetical protein